MQTLREEFRKRLDSLEQYAKTEVSNFAPRLFTMKINPDKIRDVIGKGGVVIRGIQEETGTTIEIEDDGTISIACVSAEGGEAARKRIQDLTADVEVGKVYEGPITKILDFGDLPDVQVWSIGNEGGFLAAPMPERVG